VDRLERERFDRILERVMAGLPAALKELLDEVAVVVEDLPSPAVLRELGMTLEEADELCGLHTGRPFTEGSGGEGELELPAEIQLYRVGIIAEAGGWNQPDADALVQEEVRVTLLHEIGHQFGLEEEDLDELGYG
jgi:predicted Zn-dependent protease with MMP-like domain